MVTQVLNWGQSAPVRFKQEILSKLCLRNWLKNQNYEAGGIQRGRLSLDMCCTLIVKSRSDRWKEAAGDMYPSWQRPVNNIPGPAEKVNKDKNWSLCGKVQYKMEENI